MSLLPGDRLRVASCLRREVGRRGLVVPALVSHEDRLVFTDARTRAQLRLDLRVHLNDVVVAEAVLEAALRNPSYEFVLSENFFGY